MKLSREVKTGIIVVGGILLFILGFSYLKATPLFDSSKTLYAVYKNVGGLQTGTQVSINGLTVGKVHSIHFKDNSGDIVVTFSVNNSFDFSKNSRAELYDTGIIGGKGIQVHPVFDGAPMTRSGDTLISTVQPGLTELLQTRLTPLQLKIEGAVSNADSLMMNVNQVLDDRAKRDLRESIATLNDLMKNLKGSADKLNALLTDNKGKLDSSLSNFEKLTANFADLSDSLNHAGLGRTMANLQSTVSQLDALLAGIEKGDGTLGKLMKDENMYRNLNNASRELNLLLQDFRLNPKRYVNVSVFGKKQKDYALPEDDPAEKIDDQ